MLGDCPSFVTVKLKPGTGQRRRPLPNLPETEVPPPRERASIGERYSILMPGIGGTGVVTVNALLATAAWIDGLSVITLDQTGLAQKGGAVVSSVILSERADRGIGQDRLRQRGPAARLRSAWRGQRRKSEARASLAHRGRGEYRRSPHRRCGPRRRASRRAWRSGRSDQHVYAPRPQPVSGRFPPGRRSLRQPHGGEHFPAGRGLAGRPHSDFRYRHRGSHPAEQSGCRAQSASVSLGPQVLSRCAIRRGARRAGRPRRSTIARSSSGAPPILRATRTPPTPSATPRSCAKLNPASPRWPKPSRAICTS